MGKHKDRFCELNVMEPALDVQEIVIPEYILKGGKSLGTVPDAAAPKHPMLVFINSRSGGQLGVTLLESFYSLLSHKQVFDLNKEKPDVVLQRVLQHLERLKLEGDNIAKEIRQRLRLVVAGGDGTAGWLLGIVGDLKLEHPPPIATIPLGTGNNLPFSFGWGKRNPGTDVTSVKRFLIDVIDSNPMPIDSWHLVMSMEAGKALGPEAPHSLHAFRKSDETLRGNAQIYRGGFWNYFSMGMDAQVSYEFHNERQHHPEKFKNQLHNQFMYAKLGCTQGWFCAPCWHPSSKNINDMCTIQYAKHDGKWINLPISSSIRSIVLLNLPSFSGGLDPWGSPNDKKSIERGLRDPSVNDGLLEIVGFKDGWHGTFLLVPKGHGTRLAQAHKVKLEFVPSAPDHTYMRMDGEPWKQPLPDHPKGTVIEITHHAQALMLAKKGCIAEKRSDYQHRISLTTDGIIHGLQPKYQHHHHLHHSTSSSSSSSDDDDDDADRLHEARTKFGASSTFKLED